MFKIPTVWVAFSVTVIAAVMLFVKFAVAEVPLAVMLPDQFVVVVQFPLALEAQDPSAARKLGTKASDIGMKSARAILGSFQFWVGVFFIVRRGRDSHFLVCYVGGKVVCLKRSINEHAFD
jgi:hypothetical protein